MIIEIPNVLSGEALSAARRTLEAAEWVDGRVSAGHQGAQVKDNLQIPTTHPAARQVGDQILKSLAQTPLFVSAALPLHILPPMFNRYTGGQHFGTHVDGAIRVVPGTNHRLRTDLSCTLFFTGPDEYDGGELVIEDTYGSKRVKLAAGSMILYPSTSLHHVTPVTRGVRLCSFFWLQSLIRDNTQRALLFDLDVGIQRIAIDQPGHAGVVQLTGVYHNLLRQWSET
ncbi:MAG TPA: Fe2+-dependent dioxygenase [Candidatus Didemnitutus sp.]|nr:Fe2+-dependent dioxygenase [Candidatus Didemnitutus sp.]